MCKNSPSSLNVRSLVVLLQQYHRVGAGGRISPTMTSFSRVFVPAAKIGHGGGYGGTQFINRNPGLRMFSGSAGDYTKPDAHMPKNEAKEVAVGEAVATSKFSLFTWAKWIIGSLLSVTLPFWTGKFEGIRRIEEKVEEVMEEVEEVAEVVEKVATAAENVIGAVADKLPANTILKEAAEVVENASSQVAEDAHAITTFIHKVEDVKQDLENLDSMVEPIIEKIIKESKADDLKHKTSL